MIIIIMITIIKKIITGKEVVIKIMMIQMIIVIIHIKNMIISQTSLIDQENVIMTNLITIT